MWKRTCPERYRRRGSSRSFPPAVRAPKREAGDYGKVLLQSTRGLLQDSAFHGTGVACYTYSAVKSKAFPTTASNSLRALSIGSGFASLDAGGLSDHITNLIGCEWFCVASREWLLHVVRLDWADTPDRINVDRYRIVETGRGFERTWLSPSSGHHLDALPPLLDMLVTDVSGRQP